MSKGQIPDSWATTVMINVLEKITDGTHHSPTNQAVGAFKYVTAKNVQDDGVDTDGITYVSEKVHREIFARCDPRMGDILLVKDGATTGRCCINQLAEPFSMLSSVALLRTRAMTIESKFLLQWLRSPVMQKDILDTMAGAAIKRLTLKKIQNMPIIVPPLSEQKRIVAKIESTQEKIKTIESSITKAEELIKKYRESLLQKAFRGELIPQDPNEESASKLLERIRNERAKLSDGKKKKKDELPPIKPEEIPFEIPTSWEWVELQYALDKLTDGTHHSPANHPTGDFKYISAKNIRPWGIDLKNLTYVSKEVHQEIYSRCDPKLGDVLLIKDGATTGIATINTLTEPFSMLSSVALLRPSLGLNAEYLLWFIKSSFFQKQVLDEMAGAAIKRVTLKKLQKMLLPLPPMNEQARIVNTLSSRLMRLDNVENIFSTLNENIEVAANSILRSAFYGNLVEQDQSEGTGHELLAKTQSEIPKQTEQKISKKKSVPKKKRVKK